jgi:hypothetical protein
MFFFKNVQLLHYNARVPVIERFPTCRVRINANDHPPPHFHVLMNDGREAWVTIDELKIVYGKVARREISDVLSWAAAKRSMLATKFKELQR